MSKRHEDASTLLIVLLDRKSMEKNTENINKRILKTLKIVEQRGYNLTLEKLSQYLVGGIVSIEKLKEVINKDGKIEFDGKFVATFGNIKTEKCKQRLIENEKFKDFYLKIAKDYASDFVRMCPFVKCIMISGSLASEGVCKDDDIDLDLIVQDGTKYTSILLAMLVSIKYSIKYKRYFKKIYFGLLPKAICISLVLELHQTMPFNRKDGQIAFEIMSSKIIYNSDFFNKMISKNLWLNQWFPQIFGKDKNNYGLDNNNFKNNQIRFWPKIFENLSRKSIFFISKILRLTRFKHNDLRQRMDYVEKAKQPYGIFDIPKRKNN